MRPCARPDTTAPRVAAAGNGCAGSCSRTFRRTRPMSLSLTRPTSLVPNRPGTDPRRDGQGSVPGRFRFTLSAGSDLGLPDGTVRRVSGQQDSACIDNGDFGGGANRPRSNVHVPGGEAERPFRSAMNRLVPPCRSGHPPRKMTRPPGCQLSVLPATIVVTGLALSSLTAASIVYTR